MALQEDGPAPWSWLALLYGIMAGIGFGVLFPGMFAIAAVYPATYGGTQVTLGGVADQVLQSAFTPLPLTCAGFAVVLVLCMAGRGERLPGTIGATLAALLTASSLLAFL